MNISDIKLGKTWFSWGERADTRKVVKIEPVNNRFLVECADDFRGWWNVDFFPDFWKDVPNDLHDKDGKPLKMGDPINTSSGTYTVRGAHLSAIFGGNVSIEYTDDVTNGFSEAGVTKVEPVETVDDVRAWAHSNKWVHDWMVEVLDDIIDRTEQAVRAEYER